MFTSLCHTFTQVRSKPTAFVHLWNIVRNACISWSGSDCSQRGHWSTTLDEWVWNSWLRPCGQKAWLGPHRTAWASDSEDICDFIALWYSLVCNPLINGVYRIWEIAASPSAWYKYYSKFFYPSAYPYWEHRNSAFDEVHRPMFTGRNRKELQLMPSMM